MKKDKSLVVSILILIISALIIYYFMLPPLNPTSIIFWLYVFILLIEGLILSLNSSIDKKGGLIKFTLLNKLCLYAIIIVIIIVTSVNLICSPLFNSKAYSKRIIIDEGKDFVKDIAPVEFDKLPLLDKDSSQKLGDRVMGQMPEMVSQFYVSDIYNQINYNDRIVRVTPLEYNGFFKYLNNRKKGITGYITVDSVNGESKLVKIDKGMKYMDSAIFSEDLNRHLRFSYPCDVFGKKSFEINNEGKPFWIIPVMKFKGIDIRREVKAVIILDPISGKSSKYKIKEVPKWVDHVYSADLIMEQVDDWGKYNNGFFNSIFGQKNVFLTTRGYNYTVMNDDVYLYTGITSVASDEANIGFVLSNLRTKETSFYKVAGAEEYSAMASSEGQVQQMKYTSTFPLLINLNNRPTYLMSLKDDAGLVKMYSFVDVVDYQKVVVTDASNGIEKASANFLNDERFRNNNKTKEKEIIISEMRSFIIDGNTNIYIIDNDGKKYKVSIKVNESKIPYLKASDKIKIKYITESEVTEIINID